MRAQTHTNSLQIDRFNTSSIFKCIISSLSVNLTYGNNITKSTKMSISYSSFSLTNQLTPWSRVLLQKPPVAQLLKKLSTLYGTRKFITVFTRVRQWSLSWARWIQSIPSQPIHYPPTLCLGTPNGLSPSGFPTETLWPDRSDYIASWASSAQFTSSQLISVKFISEIFSHPRKFQEPFQDVSQAGHTNVRVPN
jgi:hypothetical protein